MKRLLSKKGFTLLETLLAIAIVAAIALPLLSVFVQSAKTQRAALGVLSANYISQDYLEKLETATYENALKKIPVKASVNGYSLSASITPYGTAATIFPHGCGYVHLLFYGDGRMLAVMPDGKWRMFSAVPSSISLSAGNKTYAFTGGSVSLSGSMDSSTCAVIINAMAKPSGNKCAVTLGTGCKALRYCKESDTNDIAISGTSETYGDMISGDTSMIHVKTQVYETSGGSPVATGESYIDIRNW